MLLLWCRCHVVWGEKRMQQVQQEQSAVLPCVEQLV